MPVDDQEATSDTGELRRDWGRGIYTINTPMTQAALGWIGGSHIQLPAIDLQLQTRHVSLAVQSLDNRTIERSQHLLVSIGTRSVLRSGTRTNFLVEPIAGTVRIKAPAGLRAYRNGPLNQWIEWPSSYESGAYHVKFDGTRSVQWLILRPPSLATQDGNNQP